MKTLLAFFLLCLLILAACSQTRPLEKGEEKDVPDAAKTGESMRCISKAEGATVTTLLKDKKLRSETETQGLTTIAIFDGQCSYVWNLGSSSGTKVCADFANAEKTPNVQYAGQGVNGNCVKTSVSNNEFMPPSSVTFADLSSYKP